ncbi:MAG: hypothetical protein ABEJ79_06120 [Halolamina sp.]
MTMEEPAQECYAAVVERLSDAERKRVAEAAALAGTADRLAQTHKGDDREGMAVELRRLADYQARLEELALATEPASESDADADIDP